MQGRLWTHAGFVAMDLPRRGVVRVSLLLCALVPAIWVNAEEIRISVAGTAANHVYPAGQAFNARVQVDSARACELRFFWRDFRGQRITDPGLVPCGEVTDLTSPAGYSGYLGLVLEPEADLALPDREPGEAREYGFALLPEAPARNRQPDPRSRFGMVHADLDDPYLYGWIKTLTWKSTSPEWWGREMAQRRARGLLELPIVVGAEWQTPDDEPVSSVQLERLKARVLAYFAADPDTAYWETGIEENLRHRYDTSHYWPNLAAKARVVRQAADAVNPDIGLVYQVAELRPEHVQAFLNSAAARYFDILSLHPYAWPDFPDPERWLEDYLDTINELITASHRRMPLWFTEVGAPQRGNHPDGFFGYPGKGKEVPGKSAGEAVIYLIKLHIMAYHRGVEKIFWYNYRDRKPQREYAENHFGLRDYQGYPKPVYPAYLNLQRHLQGTTAGRARQPLDGVRVYTFHGTDTDVAVAWTFPAVARDLPVGELLPGRAQGDIIKLTDPVGNPLPRADGSIRVSGEPVFILVRARKTATIDRADK